MQIEERKSSRDRQLEIKLMGHMSIEERISVAYRCGL